MRHWSELIQATAVPKTARNHFHTELKLKKFNEALKEFKKLDYIETITTFLNLDRLEIGQGFLNENGRSWCHFISKFKNKKFSTMNYGRLIVRIK